MKRTLPLLLSGFALAATSALTVQAAPPASVWAVSEGISAPESAYVDPDSGLLFLSQIGEGGATTKDGDGWISKLTSEGKVLKNKWVTGLNSPKGLRSHEGILWVADIDSVVSIDMKTGSILKKIPVPEATFLNDLAIAPDGTVYVSDMLKSRVIRIKDGNPSVFIEGPELEHPNGLLVEEGKLLIVPQMVGNKLTAFKLEKQ